MLRKRPTRKPEPVEVVAKKPLPWYKKSMNWFLKFWDSDEKILCIAKSGDVVFLKHDGYLTDRECARFNDRFSSVLEKTGVQLVLLDKTLDVVRING